MYKTISDVTYSTSYSALPTGVTEPATSISPGNITNPTVPAITSVAGQIPAASSPASVASSGNTQWNFDSTIYVVFAAMAFHLV
jgi:hypothetical protein